MGFSNFPAIVSSTPVAKEQIFNSSGSWVKPAGVKTVQIIACGGGAGPSANTTPYVGGNASYFEGSIDISAKATGYSMPIIIGAGGAATANGGMTTVDGVILAPGGAISSDGGNQPDSGKLDSSSADLLTVPEYNSYGPEAGASYTYSVYAYKGYIFNINRYINASSVFSITTKRPNGTSTTFNAPSNSAVYTYTHEWTNYRAPSIVTDGLGTIYISGFYKSVGPVSYATVVSRDDGVTWELYDASALNTIITGTTANVQLNFWLQNNVWFAAPRNVSGKETGTILAYSTDGITWAALASGDMNNGASANQGYANYGGTLIGGILFDSTAQVWYIHRWARSGYYSADTYIYKSSSANLATATWTRMFYSLFGSTGDNLEYFWYQGMGINTLAKLANGTFIMNMLAKNGDSIGCINVPFTSATTGAPQITTFIQMNYFSVGNLYPLGFSTVLQEHTYLYYRNDDISGVRTPTKDATACGIFARPSGSGPMVSITLGDDADKSLYFNNTSTYVMWKLLKAVKQVGSKRAPVGEIGAGGVGGAIKQVGGGNSVYVYKIPEKPIHKMCVPQAINTSQGVYAVYDSTHPGTGGYFYSSTILRSGNPGQVIIRWTE
jgi:hypothetical protein